MSNTDRIHIKKKKTLIGYCIVGSSAAARDVNRCPCCRGSRRPGCRLRPWAARRQSRQHRFSSPLLPCTAPGTAGIAPIGARSPPPTTLPAEGRSRSRRKAIRSSYLPSAPPAFATWSPAAQVFSCSCLVEYLSYQLSMQCSYIISITIVVSLRGLQMCRNVQSVLIVFADPLFIDPYAAVFLSHDVAHQDMGYQVSHDVQCPDRYRLSTRYIDDKLQNLISSSEDIRQVLKLN